MPTIDSPNFWFAVAASTLAVGAYGFVMLTIGRWLEQRQVRDWIDMHAKARIDCRRCGGTGWTPIYEERALTRCPCTDATAIEELTAPVSGRAL